MAFLGKILRRPPPPCYLQMRFTGWVCAGHSGTEGGNCNNRVHLFGCPYSFVQALCHLRGKVTLCPIVAARLRCRMMMLPDLAPLRWRRNLNGHFGASFVGGFGNDLWEPRVLECWYIDCCDKYGNLLRETKMEFGEE